MHRLPGLLLLIAIATVLLSGYRPSANDGVSRHHHVLVFDVFGFETREQVAALGNVGRGSAVADVPLQPAASSGS